VNLGTLPTGWSIPAIASLTGNDIEDLLLWNQTSGILGVWMINSNGQLSGWDYVTTISPSTYSIGIGDLNDDGTNDILVENLNSGLIGAWLLTPTAGNPQVTWEAPAA
jgi:hypothetical protein